MTRQAEPVSDVAIFFDANMPKMDTCSDNCFDNKLVLCKHRFNFNALMVRSGNLMGVSDFRVAMHFLDLIMQNYTNQEPKPVFVLVTKDHDFLRDLEEDYLREIKNGTADDNLLINKRSLVCRGIKIVIVTVNCRPFGSCRIDDLRCAIKKLNQLWANGPAS